MTKRGALDDRQKWATLLRRLAELVERADSADLEDLLSGRTELNVSRERGRVAGPVPRGREEFSEERWRAAAEQLRSFRTREEGDRFLSQVAPSRAELERLARVMDLPVAKHHKTEQLRDRIIESSIGSRLGSEAIRGIFHEHP